MQDDDYLILSIDHADFERESGLEHWAAVEAAESVFRTEGINLDADDRVTLTVLTGGAASSVVGAATFRSRTEDGDTCQTFSVAVLADHQQQGLGRRLVEALVADTRTHAAGGYFRVWVVNPNMARLLDRLGFSTEGSEWSQDSPHMYLYL